MATILLVNSHAMLQEMLQSYLGILGYAVLAVNSGENAIEVYRSHEEKIHVMMTDLKLPGMNGVQLATKVSSMRPETAIIVMSGGLIHGLRRDDLPSDIRRLSKPFHPKALEDMLEDLLEAPS